MEIKEIRTYQIADEQNAIERILYEYMEAVRKGNPDSANFWRGLLTINLSQQNINEALKNEDFKTFDFVSYKSEWK